MALLRSLSQRSSMEADEVVMLKLLVHIFPTNWFKDCNRKASANFRGTNQNQTRIECFIWQRKRVALSQTFDVCFPFH